jgi:hypothetical protein
MLAKCSCLAAPIQHDSEQQAMWLAARGTWGKSGMVGLESSCDGLVTPSFEL